MTREVHDIPPAHRTVRWSAVVWRRWPLGLIGLMMAVYGGLIALMLYHARGDDARLDQGPNEHGDATVIEVDAIGDRRTAHVCYTFKTAFGHSQKGKSWGPADEFEIGQHHPVEYVVNQPGRSRLVGTRQRLVADLVSPVLGLVVLPGLLLLLLWLQGVYDLKRMIATGDVASAEPTQIERVAWVIPVMLRAEYRFRNRHAQWCEGTHWVRAHSALGVRLGDEPGRLAVVHDRAHPESSRLVVPEDFVASHGRTALPQAVRRS